jgi:hypothetical protein
MADSVHMTDCGLPGIKQIPYAMHACHFYPDRQSLVEALVPYFLAGLRSNERCIWIAADPLPADQALRELEAAAGGEVREALARDALRIIDSNRWYTETGGFKGDQVVARWLEEEQRALAEGYAGLRVTGNTSFLQAQDWEMFMEYERTVSSGLYGRRIVALCSYSLQQCNAHKATQVMHSHGCTFDRPDANWQVVAAREPDLRRPREP